jgi:hypothetical protein
VAYRGFKVVDLGYPKIELSPIPQAYYLKPRSSKTKDYNIGIYYFSNTKLAALSKIKAWNQDNVSKREDMSTRGLFFQWASTFTKSN